MTKNLLKLLLQDNFHVIQRKHVIDNEKLKQLKKRFISDIEMETRYTSAYTGKSVLNRRVMKVMTEVPRHEFVPESQVCFAYENMPLSIGNGQTISQPFIVALMTDFLMPDKDHVILDVGTGCGYQAAVLSCLVKQVISMEIIEPLATKAKQRLIHLGYKNVLVFNGNGSNGCEKYAPYDGIIVAAASPFIPPALIAQLKVGGRLIIPVGNPYAAQQLVLIQKQSEEDYSTHYFLPVAFVPLVGLSVDDIETN